MRLRGLDSARLVVVVAGLALTGCPKKGALYTPNDHGGYTLHATAGSLDDAMTRFKVTAAQICSEGSYQLTYPEEVSRDATMVTFRTELNCIAP